MAIVVPCPGCRVKLTFGDDRAGWTVDCPRCETAVAVPGAGGAPHASPAPPPLPTRRAGESPRTIDPSADALAAPLAWLLALLLAGVALLGIAVVLTANREQVKQLEEGITDLEKAERNASVGYDPYGLDERRARWLRERARDALERDAAVRRQAVANIVVAALFVCTGVVLAGHFSNRPPSAYQTAVLWGAVAGAVLGLLGAAISQVAPLWGGGFVNRAAPGTAHQLTFLASHALLAGTIGVLFGAGAAALRARTADA